VTYSSPAKTGDWARVGAYLMTAEKRDQPILVFQPLSAVPLACYYKGVNSLLPIPQPEAFRVFHDPDSLLKDEKQIASVLAQVPGDKDRIWVVTDELCWKTSWRNITRWKPRRNFIVLKLGFSAAKRHHHLGHPASLLSQKQRLNFKNNEV
jgi:hypothetical protein